MVHWWEFSLVSQLFLIGALPTIDGGRSRSTRFLFSEQNVWENPWQLAEPQGEPLSESSYYESWFGENRDALKGAASEGPRAIVEKQNKSVAVRKWEKMKKEVRRHFLRRGTWQAVGVTVALILFVYAAWRIIQIRRSKSLVALLVKPPFPAVRPLPSMLIEAGELQLLEEGFSSTELLQLNSFRLGQSVDDSCIELYLDSLQNRIYLEKDRFPFAFILTRWLRKQGGRKADLPELPREQISKYAAAKLILVPLKLPQNVDVDAKAAVQTHYVLGVIDRVNRVLRVVDAVKQDERNYELVLSHIQNIAEQLERQLVGSGKATDDLEEYRRAPRIPEPSFVSMDAKKLLGWANSLTISTGLLMLNNAATIAEGRAPQGDLGSWKDVAEILWLECAREQSRCEFLGS